MTVAMAEPMTTPATAPLSVRIEGGRLCISIGGAALASEVGGAAYDQDALMRAIHLELTADGGALVREIFTRAARQIAGRGMVRSHSLSLHSRG